MQGGHAVDAQAAAKLAQRPVATYRCSNDDKCCSEYEVCVSCCLHPSNNAASLAPVTSRWVVEYVG